jgi:hypothetical protein
MTGYWFCSFCDDTVTLPKPYGRNDERKGACCPICRNNSANWVPDKLPPLKLTPTQAHALFEQVRGAVK